jgi:hypothetical protein
MIDPVRTSKSTVTLQKVLNLTPFPWSLAATLKPQMQLRRRQLGPRTFPRQPKKAPKPPMSLQWDHCVNSRTPPTLTGT